MPNYHHVVCASLILLAINNQFYSITIECFYNVNVFITRRA